MSLFTLGSVKTTEVSKEPVAYHTVRSHIAKGQDFHLKSWESQMSHGVITETVKYYGTTLFITGVPPEYVPHNSVTRNLFANRLSEYGEKQGPTTWRASRAAALSAKTPLG